MRRPTKLCLNQLLLGGYKQSYAAETGIINKVAYCYWKKTHKYGVELLKSVKEAIAIDDRTGTQFWRPAIKKRK
jgi:hypothetical protein